MLRSPQGVGPGPDIFGDVDIGSSHTVKDHHQFEALPLSSILRKLCWMRLSLVKHLARSPENFGSRQLLGQDLRVCLSAFAKGRSSSHRLSHELHSWGGAVMRKKDYSAWGARLDINSLWLFFTYVNFFLLS